MDVTTSITTAMAVLAVLISGGALYYARSADRRARAQEARDQQRLLLERAEAQRREAEALSLQQANLTAASLGADPSSPGRAYRFRVINKGKAPTTDLKAWLIDARGETASEPGSYLNDGTGYLAPGESTDFVVAVTEAAAGRNPLFLKFTWNDDRPERHATTTSDTVVPAE